MRFDAFARRDVIYRAQTTDRPPALAVAGKVATPLDDHPTNLAVGANDPEFNLRREPALLQRVDGQKDVTFFSVLEPHGEYNGTAEYVHGADSRIKDIVRSRGNDAEVIELRLASGARIALGVADDSSAKGEHSVSVDGHAYRWSGSHARMDRSKVDGK